MVINTNISSITAQRHLAQSRLEMEQAMERLSSGLRINSAMDDAAGLTIAHSLDSKITSLSQAVRNANDGISLVQLAEGAMDEMSTMLTRMKELATQAINGTYSAADRANLNLEFKQLSNEITRISENTFFNGINVINSTDSISFQVGDAASDTISTTLQQMGSAYIGTTSLGATSEPVTDAILNGGTADDGTYTSDDIASIVAGQQVRIQVGNRTFVQDYVSGADAATGLNNTLDALAAQINTAFGAGTVTVTDDGGETSDGVIDGDAYLTIVSGGKSISSLDVYTQTANTNLASQDITTATQAGEALTSIDKAIADVDSYRATLGAVANRMEHAANNLMSRVEHQQSARSRIQDADYAVESANLAKAQVLQQAGTAMLAQANASSQNILSLLK
jgi:flagellin